MGIGNSFIAIQSTGNRASRGFAFWWMRKCRCCGKSIYPYPAQTEYHHFASCVWVSPKSGMPENSNVLRIPRARCDTADDDDERASDSAREERGKPQQWSWRSKKGREAPEWAWQRRSKANPEHVAASQKQSSRWLTDVLLIGLDPAISASTFFL